MVLKSEPIMIFFFKGGWEWLFKPKRKYNFSNVICDNWSYKALKVCVSRGCAAAGQAQWMTPAPLRTDAQSRVMPKPNQIFIKTRSQAPFPILQQYIQ